MNKNYSFSVFNDNCSIGISQALKECNFQSKQPIFVCIGSDLVLGDSLGPLIGTLLRRKNINAFVYGTLENPITAKEVQTAGPYVKEVHPDCITIAIDAAVGNQDDVGLIRIIDDGLKPGLGVNKKLAKIGDISIIAVVSGKSLQNESLFNLTRLNLIYKMSNAIADGIEKYLLNTFSNDKQSVNILYGA